MMYMIRKLIPLAIILPALLLVFISCSKDDIGDSPDFRLTFSTDTLSFDTIFTSMGSATRRFIVKNPNRQPVNISRVYLAGGGVSEFRLNINGKDSHQDSDVFIAAGDSMFVFVEVTINPGGKNSPMVIKDSVVFELNGNLQDVKLIAFGQDFHLINGQRIKSQRWENDKPYLIYNSVLVEPGETLTIGRGCRIHFHRGSGMFVLGTLKVEGVLGDPVYFQGDRLEKAYENVPGQWGAWSETTGGNVYVFGGIHLAVGSKDNSINYAIIRNGTKGIQADSLGASANPMLTMSNTRIENMSVSCLTSHGSNIKAHNCIFSNSGYQTLALLYGGDYDFTHCTVANYYSLATRTTPSVILGNYLKAGGETYSYDLTKANFSNCIVYGSSNNELRIDKGGTGTFNYRFTNCLMKTDNSIVPSPPHFENCLFNSDPKFLSIGDRNFGIDGASPARNKANKDIAGLFPFDIFNNSRIADEGPDIGAVEWVPAENK
jgi:hypothetical protein